MSYFRQPGSNSKLVKLGESQIQDIVQRYPYFYGPQKNNESISEINAIQLEKAKEFLASQLRDEVVPLEDLLTFADDFLKDVEKRHLHAIPSAGHPIGINLPGTIIGPLSQTALNSGKSAGQSSGDIPIIDMVKNIMLARRSQKGAKVTIGLQDPWHSPGREAELTRYGFENIKPISIKYLVKKFEYYSPKKFQMQWWHEEFFRTVKKGRFEFDGVCRMVFDIQKLYNHRIVLGNLVVCGALTFKYCTSIPSPTKVGYIDVFLRKGYREDLMKDSAKLAKFFKAQQAKVRVINNVVTAQIILHMLVESVAEDIVVQGIRSVESYKFVRNKCDDLVRSVQVIPCYQSAWREVNYQDITPRMLREYIPYYFSYAAWNRGNVRNSTVEIQNFSTQKTSGSLEVFKHRVYLDRQILQNLVIGKQALERYVRDYALEYSRVYYDPKAKTYHKVVQEPPERDWVKTDDIHMYLDSEGKEHKVVFQYVPEEWILEPNARVYISKDDGTDQIIPPGKKIREDGLDFLADREVFRDGSGNLHSFIRQYPKREWKLLEDVIFFYDETGREHHILSQSSEEGWKEVKEKFFHFRIRENHIARYIVFADESGIDTSAIRKKFAKLRSVGKISESNVPGRYRIRVHGEYLVEENISMNWIREQIQKIHPQVKFFGFESKIHPLFLEFKSYVDLSREIKKPWPDAYHFQTAGGLYSEVCVTQGVDATVSYCSDTHELSHILGIDTCANICVKLLNDIFSSIGYTDIRHLRLIVSELTSSGYVRSLKNQRAGREDFMTLAGFQQIPVVMASASLFSNTERIKGSVTVPVAIGSLPPLGTGYVHVEVKDKKIEGFTESKGNWYRNEEVGVGQILNAEQLEYIRNEKFILPVLPPVIEYFGGVPNQLQELLGIKLKNTEAKSGIDFSRIYIPPSVTFDGSYINIDPIMKSFLQINFVYN